MPTCLECGEEIPRGMYCARHRSGIPSTLGVVVENDRERVERGGTDERTSNNPNKSDDKRGTYRGK